jgi:nucleoside-specific outer membrane channel protein Tsx
MSYSNSIFRRTHEEFLALFVAALAFLVAATGQAQAQGSWLQQAELTAADGSYYDDFGQSVAVSGSTMVVGAPGHTVGSNFAQGVAYVFVESGGLWKQQAVLSAADGTPSDGFGDSVAISGSTIVVGAPFHPSDVYGDWGPGAAYVFVQSGGTWTQQAELTASDGVPGDWFGLSVAISGSTALIGSENNAAYVFVQNGTTWSQQAELTASDAAPSDQFGYSVALIGSTALIGSVGHTVGSNYAQGAAYVFVESGGTWTQQAELTASDGAYLNRFGQSVSVDGSTIVVGASGHAQYQGAAYVFTESGGKWSQQAELTASDGVASDAFGYAVALNGSTVVVGARNHPASGSKNPGPGAAYVFDGSGGTWTQQAKLTASDGLVGDFFGISVAMSGSTVAAGAYGHQVGGNSLQGAAYVFVPGTSTVSLSPSSLSFGNETVNDTSAAKTVTLTNTGAAALTISSVAASTGFAISSTTCGATLAANKTCKLWVTFTPAQMYELTGTLTFTDNGNTDGTIGQQTVGLTGTGTADATLAPAGATYAKRPVGTTSAAKTFTLINHRPVGLSIAISVTGDFAMSGTTCGTVLAARSTCTVSVAFTPTEMGGVAGQLIVSHNGFPSPLIVNLSGTGTADATLTPSGVPYPTLKVGRTSAPRTFTLINHQPVDLTSISISTAGDFAVSATTCGTSLAAEAKCTISVRFTPTETGLRTGQLIISESGTPSPLTADMSGMGE